MCASKNVENRQELARFEMTQKGSHTGLMVASISRDGNDWVFKAVGSPLPGTARTPRDVIDPARAYL